MNNDDLNKINELEKLLKEREKLLKEKEKIVLEMKSKIEEQDTVQNHLLEEINNLKNSNEKKLLGTRGFSSDTDRIKDLEEQLKKKEDKLKIDLEEESKKQNKIEKELNKKYINEKNNCLELKNTLINLIDENEKITSELNDNIFKNAIINISLNNDVLKLNTKYNGFGLLFDLNDDLIIVNWINPENKNLIQRNSIIDKLEIKNSTLFIKQKDSEKIIEIKFNPDFKIEFEDIGIGFKSNAFCFHQSDLSLYNPFFQLKIRNTITQ